MTNHNTDETSARETGALTQARTYEWYWVPSMLILGFLLGVGGGYLLWGPAVTPASPDANEPQREVTPLLQQINPPAGYQLPVSLNDLGPRLVEAGVIDISRFALVYQNAGSPLTDEQMKALVVGSADPVLLERENAYFLLNFFWAVGLANQNRILTEGPMMDAGSDRVGQFASTGGWTLGVKPAVQLYASVPLIELTAEQQSRLERVAQAVYRPCCNNPTHFPDCNHGMAMLGLLTLMASEDASEDAMFRAAKYANAFWYPQQTFELALYFDATEGQSFAEVDAARLVSREYSSGAGFNQVHEYLAANGLLQQTAGGGNSCGV